MSKSKRDPEKEAFWRLVREEHQQSGLTAREFCRNEGLNHFNNISTNPLKKTQLCNWLAILLNRRCVLAYNERGATFFHV